MDQASVNQQQEHQVARACDSSSPAQSSTNIPIPMPTNPPDQPYTNLTQNYYHLPPPPVVVAVPPQQQQHQELQSFWANQMQLITEQATTDFKNHSLPLARIKKIMKADEDVRMIAAEAPIVFEKACEMFVLELTLRSWIHTEENKRRTLQKCDIAAAIARTDLFDFLVDVIPRNRQLKEEELADSLMGSTHDDVVSSNIPMEKSQPQPQSGPYYYVAGKNQMGSTSGMYRG